MKTDYVFISVLVGMLFFLGFVVGVMADAVLWAP